ncbi:MAG: glycosyltransferase family 4 protein, partial [Acidimicrobiales bacterium]|nr:glycosyltransferase family 4 protein [Acidimicrobiales bacterium]
IKDFEPRTVVVQNYLIPAVEELVYRTARSSGTRIVMVVHDHRHHTLLSGTHLGLKNQIRSADAVVCHSRFVAREVLRSTGRKPTIIPLPPPLGVLAARQPYGSVLPELEPGKLRAVHLGVLSRRSGKGTDVVVEIAKRKPVGLEMVFLGSGAPIVEGAITIDGFLDAGVLTQAVSSASLALLPYRFASQSGVIPLCQALGVVPVVTNVGGLSEQVDHGRTGFIMSENSTTDDWLSLLRNLNVKTLDEMTTYMMEDSDRRLAEFGEQSLLVVN